MAWNELFSEGDLGSALENRRTQVAVDIRGTPAEHVLQADEEAWADALVERYRVETPVLRRDEVWLQEPQEIRIDVSGDPGRDVRQSGGPVLVLGYRVDIHIPFDGDPRVFGFRASQFSWQAPRAVVHETDLVHIIEYAHDRPPDIKAHAGQLVDSVELHLSWSRTDIENHNAGLKQVALQAIRERRQQVEAHKQHIAATGLPVGPPDREKKTYIADVLVRRPAPKLPTNEAESVRMEPVISGKVFEHILGAVRATGESMESNPGTYATMGEEDLRQIILTGLNGHYRGKATAEAFNQKGKTDILVRHEGDNLFIGECKFWGGPQGFGDTVDQLFRYTGWRDTKLAIVMFVRQRGLTDIIEKARETLEAHERFVGWMDAAVETELRATMNWPGDERRHADLNVFFVHLPAER